MKYTSKEMVAYCRNNSLCRRDTLFKVVSSEFYFHKPITVHIELYLFYHFIHFLLYIGQY